VSRPVFLCVAVAFLALAGGVALTGVLPGDAWLRDLILAHASPSLIAVMRWINVAGSWRVLVPAAPLLLLFPGTRRHWWIWLLLLLAAPSLEYVLKPLVGRARPEGLAFGFPSGHATATAAYMSALAWAAADLRPLGRWLLRALAAAMVVLVGLARIVLRAHWPSDVLGGIALGLACAVGAVLIASSLDRARAGSASPEAARDAPSRTPPAPG
jgi:undecaprenyl-diphosphatase